MAVYSYTRVSTDRQANEGESLGAQDRTVAGYAMMHGLAVDRTFVERGVSGSTPLADRPAGRDLLEALQPGDVVITPKLDRMFRSASDALHSLEAMKRLGVSLHMIDLGGDVTGNGVAKLVFTILSAVAEAERDRIRERIANVKADQRKRGRYLGGAVPFGYSLAEGGELVPDPDQQEAIAQMVRMRRQGVPLREVAARMKACGHDVTHAGVAKIVAASERRETPAALAEWRQVCAA